MKRIIKYIFLFLVLFIPVSIKAEDGFNLNVEESINSSSEINGSSVLVGDNVESSSSVKGIEILLGNDVSLNGNSEYAVILGNDVELSGNVLNDGLILGNIISFDSNFVINRDLFVFGNTITLKGTFNRDVTIYASQVIVEDAEILGNISINAEIIDVMESVNVNGTLSYNDSSVIDISNKANLSNVKILEDVESVISVKDYVYNFIISYASVLLIFVVLAFVIPKLFEKINNKVKEFNLSNIFVLFGFGLLMLVFLPIILIVLMGIPVISSLTILLLLVYIIIVCLSKIIFGYFLGNIIWNKFIKKDNNILLIGLLGISIVSILEILPVFGVFMALISTVLGMGLVFQLLRKD